MKFFSWFLQKNESIDSTHHDLKAIFHRVNTEYFEGKVEIPVKWFGSREWRRRNYFRFGSYNLRTKVVKVHRMLDDPAVPEYCVAFIVYHEMLHHVLPPLKSKGGRRKIHHPAFVLREKEFREYALASTFLKNMVR